MSLYFIKIKYSRRHDSAVFLSIFSRMEVKDMPVKLLTVCRVFNYVKRPVTTIRNREVHVE